MNSSSASSPSSTTVRARGTRLMARRVFWIVLAIVALLLGYKLTRSGMYAWSAYQSGTALLQIGQKGLTPDSIPQLQGALDELTAAVGGIEAEVRPFTPLLRRLGLLPTYGGTIAAAPDLLVAGRELTAVGSETLRIVAPTLAADGMTELAEALPSVLAGQQTTFQALADRAAVAQEALARVPVNTLHPALAGRFAQAQPLFPAMAPGLRMAPMLPELLGLTGPRTYLLLVQNNHELRGTGGFLTAVGQITVDGGKIAALDFMDSYDVRRDDVEHAWAPDPMRRYMGVDLLFLRDANWSPDLPTSAQAIRGLYAQDQGVAVDGVITVDLRAVELIIDALGALTVPGADEAITGATIIDQIKAFWSAPLTSDVSLATDGVGAWWRSRKDFMPILAQAALERVQSGQVDHVRVLEAMLKALDERAIQAWVVHRGAAAELAGLGWDGGLAAETGLDFVALVDSNLGYNKVDSVLERSLTYTVSWSDGPNQPAFAEAVIVYRHPVNAENHQCDITPRYGASYDEMAARCYFDYVRLYVPAGSELLSVDGVVPDSATSQRGEANTQVLAGYFVMPPASEHKVVFTYRLPASLTLDNYRLVVQRQSGTKALPLRAEIAEEQISTIIHRNTFRWALGQH